MNFLRSMFKRETKEVNNLKSNEKKSKNPPPGDGDKGDSGDGKKGK